MVMYDTVTAFVVLPAKIIHNAHDHASCDMELKKSTSSWKTRWQCDWIQTLMQFLQLPRW